MQAAEAIGPARFLGVRGERPRGRGAAEKPEKLAPIHLIPGGLRQGTTTRHDNRSVWRGDKFASFHGSPRTPCHITKHGIIA